MTYIKRFYKLKALIPCVMLASRWVVSTSQSIGVITMTDLEKPKTTRKKKPPTQTAGVTGIDGHGGMGEAPEQSIPNNAYVDWFKLVDLPAFQMFVAEQSGLNYGVTMSNWIKERRAALSDSVLYDQYASWHEAQGLWVNETPTGDIKK